jgi:hypothetical protein
MEKRKWSKYDLQNTTQKTKHWGIRTPQTQGWTRELRKSMQFLVASVVLLLNDTNIMRYEIVLDNSVQK